MEKKISVQGKQVTIVTTEKRELDKYEFFCDKCEKIHKMSMYAVAQLASGNPLVHTCDCGNKTDLEPFK